MTSTSRYTAVAAGPDRAFAHRMMATLALPIFVLDRAGCVIMWNEACERLTGVPADEMLGTREHGRCFYGSQRATLADIMLANSSSDQGSLYARHVAHAPSARLNAESWCEMPRTGRRRYLAADATPVFDDEGRLAAVVETLRDLTDEKEAQVALEQLATRDGLTGLANRRCFDDTLQAEWTRATRSEQPLSLLMVDVDHFKAYNDQHGHLGGDACLKQIAGAVAGEMRANDLVARYGGEEFAVILPNQSLKGAAIVAERIRARVEQLHMPGAATMTAVSAAAARPALALAEEASPASVVTVSIGAATAMASHQHTASELVAIADAALYRAKHMGRNRISMPF
jgi:diguanylate cyclase (GGDEF)-like protein